MDDPNETKIHLIAQQLGLKCIGWIFTDLYSQNGILKCLRGNSQTYFLSAEECITAAYFQDKYRNNTRFAPTGQFGSKFVTVVVTGILILIRIQNLINLFILNFIKLIQIMKFICKAIKYPINVFH